RLTPPCPVSVSIFPGRDLDSATGSGVGGRRRRAEPLLSSSSRDRQASGHAGHEEKEANPQASATRTPTGTAGGRRCARSPHHRLRVRLRFAMQAPRSPSQNESWLWGMAEVV